MKSERRGQKFFWSIRQRPGRHGNLYCTHSQRRILLHKTFHGPSGGRCTNGSESKGYLEAIYSQLKCG